MNKIFAITGAIAFIAAVGFGSLAQFDGSVVIEISVAAFALCASCAAILRRAKEKGALTKSAVLAVAFAVVAGVLCCLGGLSQSIFAEISGMALALITVIFGLIYAGKKKEEKNA